MIADLDETLRQLLIAEIPVKNGEVEISFDQPKREWSGRLSRPSINLFLYDVRENNVLRQHQWERLPDNGDGRAHLKRSPFRVDCFYMLTTWAAEPDDEHRLLTRALLALFRFPILTNDRLVGSLKNPPFEIQARLAAHDRLTNPAEVWSSLDNELRPSVSYIVTLALDPWKEITGPVVKTLTLRTGEAFKLPQERFYRQDVEPDEIVFIGGTVRDKAKGVPQAGIDVALKGTGYIGKTDDQGNFIFRGLQPGDYTLVAWFPEGKPGEPPRFTEKKIAVPRQGGSVGAGYSDYDLELG
jgi:hypothetical protein